MISKKIEFTSPVADLIDQPKPSLLTIPEAYKKMSKRLDDSINVQTVKACMPFLDALTMGYIITFPVDFCIELKNIKEKDNTETTEFHWHVNSNFPPKYKNLINIGIHSNDQISEDLRSKNRTIDAVFKIRNPWLIKTPPGYSCIFTQPFNRNLPFKIIDGIVDTDDFNFCVNFPAFWTNPISQKETIIEKGTPLALVIPFKRESWKMKIQKGTIETEEECLKSSNFLIDWYKKVIWKKKSYK